MRGCIPLIISLVINLKRGNKIKSQPVKKARGFISPFFFYDLRDKRNMDINFGRDLTPAIVDFARHHGLSTGRFSIEIIITVRSINYSELAER